MTQKEFLKTKLEHEISEITKELYRLVDGFGVEFGLRVAFRFSLLLIEASTEKMIELEDQKKIRK